MTLRDLGNHILWLIAVDSAAERNACAEDLLHGASKGLGLRAVTHLTSHLVDVVHGQIAAVLD